ncbi:mitochondrial peptidyl-tRNA hydrolase [Xylariaceae sp. FL1651]|nr:mitochondrial peptidyl-tRNA hydrolase [Xylariaceae sp. FL1651]
MPAPRFLVVSLGNQAPYFDCLHSAGHFALSAVQKALAPSQPHFASERYGKKSCMASSSQQYTLIQSPTMMNNCGPWVHAAWKEMLQRHQLQPSELGLVLVHDELEADLGEVRIRKWKTSHRGHNGVKSVKNNMDQLNYPKDHWSRILIGIGRPEERTPSVVSDYVLRKMTPFHMKKINGVGSKVIRCLQELQDEWEKDNSRRQANS